MASSYFDIDFSKHPTQLVRENKIKRVELLAAAQTDEAAKQLIIEKCRRSCTFFINYFIWTYDPRTEGRIPFALYQFQYEIIDQIVDIIDNQKDCVIEKSRDMGVSWLVLMIFLWFFLFKPASNFKLGSKTENDVDKIGELSTLFPKLRYAMANLPTWLLPDGFNERKHSKHLSILNPANNNSIDGESSNPTFSRSGRYRAVLFDEFAFWPFSNPAWASALGSTNCRLAVSTPYGKGNKFASLSIGKPDEVCHNKITIHWSKHPLKDENWYKGECARSTLDEIARELDINYSLSTKGVVVKEFKRAYHVTSTEYEFNPEWRTVVGFDFGTTNGCVIAQIDKFDALHVFKEIVLFEDGNDDHLAQALLNYLAKLDFSVFQPEFTADPSGRNRLASVSDEEKSTHIKILESHGIKPILYEKAMRMRNREKDGIALMRNLFNRRNTRGQEYITIYEQGCETLVQSLETEYKYKVDRNGEVLDIIEQKHPWEDVVDMLRYIIIEHYSAEGLDSVAPKAMSERPKPQQAPDVEFYY